MDNPVIYINMLGEFSLSYQSKKIDDNTFHSRKSFTLLEFLIANRHKELSQYDLIDILWPDNEIENPMSALKTLLHRLRKLLTSLEFPKEIPLIIQSRGSYGWNPLVNVSVDTDHFETLCRLVEKKPSQEQQLKLLSQIHLLYKGDFLPRSATQFWVIPISAYYHSLYLKMMHKYLELLVEYQDYETCSRICCDILSVDAYDEVANFNLTLSLYKAGNVQTALQQYQHSMEQLFNQYGTPVIPKFEKLHQLLLRDLEQADTTLAATLSKPDTNIGAIFYDYQIFQTLYSLELRKAKCNNEPICLCIITIHATSQSMEKQYLVKQIFINTILPYLRSDDFLTLTNDQRLFLVLPKASVINSQNILRRIKQCVANNKKLNFLDITYQVVPLHKNYDNNMIGLSTL